MANVMKNQENGKKGDFFEINDPQVWRQMGRLEALGEATGHIFEVTLDSYGYAVWTDGNDAVAMTSGNTAATLERYVDGLRDMFMMLNRGKQS